MTSGASRTAARELGTLFRIGTIGGLTDAQLLEQLLQPLFARRALEVAPRLQDREHVVLH